MAIFSVAILIILIGVGLTSVRGDPQQNKTETEGDIKHLFGLDGLSKIWLEKIVFWNASDCHPKIVINESTNAIQRNATGTEEFLGGHINGLPFPRSCRAGPIQMPSASAAGRIGIIYTEYRIVAGNGPLHIGLSTKEMPLDDWLGNGRVSYGYANYGMIESKNANGNYTIIVNFGKIDYKNANGIEVRISDNVTSFRIGDVVGCGLNWATRQVFFTKNGQRLNNTNLYVEEDTVDLYPTVTLTNHLDAVEANFGPNFKYDLSKEF